MGQPDEHRAADDLVEPLFAGLRGADSPGDEGREAAESGSPDPWRHPARPAVPTSEATNLDPDPLPLRLYLKALFFMIALIGIAAGFYFVFGV